MEFFAGKRLGSAWRASLCALIFTVTPAFAVTTTTSLAITSGGSAVTTVASGSVVTLTATVYAGAAPVTTGEVNFCDAMAAYCTDIHLLGTAQLTGSGKAALKFVPGIGGHSYKAVFLGTNSNAASSSGESTLQVKGLYPSMTTLSLGGRAYDYTLTAAVTGSAADVPSGPVSFLDTSNNNISLGKVALVPGTASLGFVNLPTPETGNAPASIAVGDFNGDGIEDLATVNATDSTVTVLFGKGDGTFTAAAISLDAGLVPVSIAVGDFNGDGKADLVVASVHTINTGFGVGAGALTILLGNGDGTFTAAATSPATGTWPSFVAAADFNGDGIEDLAVANLNTNNTGYGAGTLTILLGNGDGTFMVAPSPSTGYGPSWLAIGDFNNDGKVDIAVANISGSGGFDANTGSTVTVLLGNGDGTFTAAASPATGYNPASLVAGDFNGDGNLDIAVANEDGNTITVLLGNGNGSFTAAASPDTGDGPGSIVEGDFNGDGVPDLATANHLDNTVTVLLGNGDGTFTLADSPSTSTYPPSAAVGDFNGDGFSDIAVGSTVLLAQVTQKASASVDNVIPAGIGTHEVEASYPGDSSYSASVSSTVAVAGPATTVTVSPTSITFGATPGNNSNPSIQTITVKNSGAAALVFSSSGIFISGANATSFAQTNTCGAGLAVGASCTINVTFTPTANGALLATVSIGDNAVGSPQTVALSGTGLPPASVTSLSPSSITFPNTPVGNTAPTQSITLTNTGTAPLVVSSISISTVDTNEFFETNNCPTSPATIAVAASCTINVSFAATGVGLSSGSIVVTDYASGSPQAVPISATAHGDGGIIFDLSTTAVTLAPGSSGNSTITATGIGGYAGPSTITLRDCTLSQSPTGATDSPSCTIIHPTVTMASGSTAGSGGQVTIGFTPATASAVKAARPANQSSLRQGDGFGAAALAGLLLLVIPVRRRSRKSLLLGLLCFAAALTTLSGCGSRGGGSDGGGNGGTTAGTYTFTITGVDSYGTTNTGTITVTVS
jgi:hypothetical protein